MIDIMINILLKPVAIPFGLAAYFGIMGVVGIISAIRWSFNELRT